MTCEDLEHWSIISCANVLGLTIPISIAFDLYLTLHARDEYGHSITLEKPRYCDTI
jgi:hypothetical protein